jgi:hypothetical protein
VSLPCVTYSLKHANPNNQSYYYIITFTQYTKYGTNFLIDMKGK